LLTRNILISFYDRVPEHFVSRSTIPAIGGHVFAPMSALAIVTLSVFSAVKADEMLKRRQEEIGKASDSLVMAAPTSAAVLFGVAPVEERAVSLRSRNSSGGTILTGRSL
jgi:hypothetical protein